MRHQPEKLTEPWMKMKTPAIESSVLKKLALRAQPRLSRTLILAVSSVISCAAILQASDLVWIGGTGNWNAAANWSPAQIPAATDNVWITNNGPYTVTVPAGSTANAASLTVGGAGGTQDLAI